jgi:iron complex outermembrane receptor protein
MRTKPYLLASSAIVAAALVTSAHAQTKTAAAVAEEVTIEELVVTAERREQSLQDVPVAISAFTANRRELLGITSIFDMTNFTPGLQYSSSLDRMSLRGLGRTTSVRAADPSVSVYSDGIYEPANIEAGKSPLFLDRIEVLRGPQATLYGRNAIAGAINLVSKRPTEDMYGEVRATYGSYNHSIVEGAVSGPTVIPGVLFRFAANWEKQTEGWFDNIVPGQPDEGNVIDTNTVEGQLKFKFNENFEGWAKLTAIQWRNGSGGAGSRTSWEPGAYATYQVGVSPNTSENPGYGCSGRVTAALNLSPTGCVNPAANDPRKFAAVVPFQVKVDDTFIFASDWTWHASDFDIKYTTGGTRYHYSLTRPRDTTVAPVSQYTLPGGLVIRPQEVYSYQEFEEWWSHELNFASTNDGPVQWMAGLYSWNEHYRQPATTYLFDQPQLAAPLNASCPRTASLCAPDTILARTQSLPMFHIQSQAAYAQLDWKFMEHFKATAGLRYSSDRKSGSEQGRVICFAFFQCTPGAVPGGFLTPEITSVLTPAVDLTQQFFAPISGPLPTGVTSNFTYDPATGMASRTYRANWRAVTGNFVLAWDPDPDTHLYFRYSRGYKPGGFRAGYDVVLTASPYTKSEQLDDFEIGLKKNFGRTLQANIAIFRYNYRDAQIPLSIIDTTGAATASRSTFYNIPEAISQGIELESIWQPVENLQVLFNYSYLDAHITDAIGPVDPADPAALDPRATPITALKPCTPATSTDIYTCFTGGGYQRGQNLSGQKLPNAPRNKVAIDVNYTWRMPQGSLTGAVTYVWRDSQYGSIFNRAYTLSPSWDQWDARLTYRPEGGKFTIIAYGKNLLDSIGYEGGATAARKAGFIGPATPGFTETPVVQGISTSYPLSPPRTYGVEVQYRFF